VSGGLLEFTWEADHQTLGEALDEAARRVTSYLGKTTGKSRLLCLLMFWNADSKSAALHGRQMEKAA
jgi:hypothetical protein